MFFKKTVLFAALLLSYGPAALAGPGDEELGHMAPRSAIDTILPFSEGLAAIKIQDKWGFVDLNGKLVIAPQFEEVQSFANGLATAKKDHKVGYIDPKGAWQISPQFAAGYDFGQKTALVMHADGHQSLINRQGEEVLRFPGHINPCCDFDRGLLYANRNFPVVLRNADGRAQPLPANATHVQGNFVGNRMGAAQQVPEEPYQLYGYLDTEGHWAIPPRFAEINSFTGAVALVREPKQQEGLINRQGEYVLPPVQDKQQIRLLDNGLYAVKNAEEKISLLLNRDGKVVYGPGACAEADYDAFFGDWILLTQCEQKKSLLLSNDGRRIDLPLQEAKLERSENSSLVIIKGKPVAALQAAPQLQSQAKAENNVEENAGPESFVIVDRQGKIIVDGETLPLRGQYRSVTLIAPNKEGDQAPHPLLPLAFFSDFESLYILTRDLRIVHQPEWRYESNLLDYNAISDHPEGPMVVSTKRGWGAIDGQGQWVVQPEWDNLGRFHFGLAHARQYRLEQLVDAQGNRYPEPEERYSKRVAPETLQLRTDQGDILYNVRTQEKTPLPSETEWDESATRAGLMPQYRQGKWGLVNRQGHWVAPPTWDNKPTPLERVPKTSSGQRAAANVAPQFMGWDVSIGVDSYRKHQPILHGVVSPEGQPLIPLKYAQIQVDENGLFLVHTHYETQGVYSPQGQEIIAANTHKLAALGEGWYSSQQEAESGFLDETGQWAIGPYPLGNSASSFPSNRPYIQVSIHGETALMDRQGRLSTQAKPLTLAQDTPDLWWADWDSDEDTTTYYGYDWKPRLHIKGAGEDFVGGLAIYKDFKHDTEGLINGQGKQVFPAGHYSVRSQKEGLSVIVKAIPAKNSKNPEAIERQYGYANAAGKMALPWRYTAAQSFSEKRAAVGLDSNIGIIDPQGKVILASAWQCNAAVLLDGAGKVIWTAHPECKEPVKKEPPPGYGQCPCEAQEETSPRVKVKIDTTKLRRQQK